MYIIEIFSGHEKGEQLQKDYFNRVRRRKQVGTDENCIENQIAIFVCKFWGVIFFINWYFEYSTFCKFDTLCIRPYDLI